jgi:alpha-glucosidase
LTTQALATPADATSAARWWRGATIYQVYPRSFADSNGDGEGDLAGVTAHLDYIAALGVDAIWLSPFFTSPMRDSGYDVADYRDVDPLFGTLADFDRLVAKAHGLGLKVLIDQVYAHTSDAHRWFQSSRESRTGARADWYVWADARPDGSPPNNWQSVFGGPAWTWDARRGQYYMHNFLREQPQLNLHNPAVQDELVDTARFWLDRGVDGFRIDAINFSMHDPQLRDNPPAAPGGKRTRPFDFQQHIYNQSHDGIPAFLERLRALFDQYPGTFSVAEVGGERAASEMKAYTQGERRLHSAYGFDFLYAEDLTAPLVKRIIAEWPGHSGEGWPSWELSNHDAPRFVSRWARPGQRDAMARIGLLLLTALRGNAIMWQGEELGLSQAHIPFERLRDPEAIANWPQTLGRDGARTPIPWRASAAHGGFSTAEPWLPMPAEHRDLAVDVQEADPHSVLHFARRLVALRRENRILREGDVALAETPDDLLVFERLRGNERLVCAFNLTDRPVAMPARPDLTALATAGGASPETDHLPPLSGYIAEPRS